MDGRCYLRAAVRLSLSVPPPRETDPGQEACSMRQATAIPTLELIQDSGAFRELFRDVFRAATIALYISLNIQKHFRSILGAILGAIFGSF